MPAGSSSFAPAPLRRSAKRSTVRKTTVPSCLNSCSNVVPAVGPSANVHRIVRPRTAWARAGAAVAIAYLPRVSSGRVDGAFQLRLVHPRAAAHAFLARLVVQLVEGA